MKKYSIWLITIAIGIINAIVLVTFEFVGVDITNWLWNDFFNTDKHRWLVIPVAWLLGLALTGGILLLREKRIVEPEEDLMEDMNHAPARLSTIGTVLAIGALSLLAGGSIGPEASLMAASAAIGALFATKMKFGSQKQLLILASISALLVAFIGSMLLALVPLLLLFKLSKTQNKSVKLTSIAVILLAGLASWATLMTINHYTGNSGGYGEGMVVLPQMAFHDLPVALILGFVSGFLAFSMNVLTKRSWRLATWLDNQKLPAKEWVIGSVFSLVLGTLYVLGGRSLEFSGSVGTGLLLQNPEQYGVLALAGLVVAKVLATAWSKGTGYRGGLVFPSIYIGVALGLLVGQLFDGLAGGGAIIGGVAGMITAAVGSPIIGGIFLIAIIPAKLWPVAACAIIGTLLFDRLIKFRHTA